MKPILSKSYAEFTLDLDNWIENLDKPEKESNSLELENIIDGSYITTYEGVKIAFELQSDLIFDFLTSEDLDTLSKSNSFLNTSVRFLLPKNCIFLPIRP